MKDFELLIYRTLTKDIKVKDKTIWTMSGLKERSVIC